MTNDTNVGLRLDFFKNLITALVNDFSNRNQFFLRYATHNNTLPVYIESTGDVLYRLERESMIQESLKKSYEKVPRIILSLQKAGFPSDGRTAGEEDSIFSQWIMGTESRWIAPSKAIGYELEFGVKIVLSDFMMVMSYMQYINEAFLKTSYPIVFTQHGNDCEALYRIDKASLNPDINHAMSDDPESKYPTMELTITATGMYPSMNYYDLESGYHGYNGTNNAAITNPSEGETNGNLVGVNNKIKKVVLNVYNAETDQLIEKVEFEDPVDE